MTSSEEPCLSFDSIYASICENLSLSKRTDTILSDLKRLGSDYERIKLILDDKTVLQDLLGIKIKDHYEAKSDVKATEYYSRWMKLDSSNKSLSLLNKALLYCPNFSYPKTPISTAKEYLEFTVVHENGNCHKSSGAVTPNEILHQRSLVLYEKGLYAKCVEDIFTSVQNGHKKSFATAFLLGQCFSKLHKFDEAKVMYEYSLNLLRHSNLDNETKSKETMKVVRSMKELSNLLLVSQNHEQKKNVIVNARDEDYFKLFDGSNTKISGTSSAVKLKFQEGRGRHMTAVKPIPPGSTLIVEQPYVWSVAPSQFGTLCQFCVKPSENPIPCCTCSSVLFCGYDCYWKAYELHSLECRILKLLDSSEKLGKMGLLCYRTIAKTPIEAIRDEVSKWNDDANLPETTILGLNEKEILDSSNYSSVYAQTPNSTERNAGDLFKRACAAIYLTLCLKHSGYFKSQLNQSSLLHQGELNSDEILVASALLRHLQSVSCNAYGINMISKGTKTLEIEEVGGATNPIISTTNHSCYPNVYRINIGNICVVKSLREISEGEEILDSYGPQFTTMSLDERQEELERQYLFRCSCNACLENWGSFKDLKLSRNKNSWRCPQLLECPGGILEDNKSGNANKRKCMKCGKTADIKRLQKTLKNFEESYLKVKDLVIRQESSIEIEKVFQYISTIQKLLKPPCMELVEAQEILKLYWNLKLKNSP